MSPADDFDRPVLVDGADERVVRFCEHSIVAGLGDRPAGGQRRQPRATAGSHLAVDLIPVQIRRDTAPPRRDAVGGQLDDPVEVLAREVGKRRRLAHQLVEVVLTPAVGGALGDDLLREDVQGKPGRVHGVERTAPHTGKQRGAFNSSSRVIG